MWECCSAIVLCVGELHHACSCGKQQEEAGAKVVISSALGFRVVKESKMPQHLEGSTPVNNQLVIIADANVAAWTHTLLQAQKHSSFL